MTTAKVSRYAVVNTYSGMVENVVMWDGQTPYSPGEGFTVIELADDSRVQAGYHYVDGEFIAPPPPEPLPEEAAALLERKRQGNMAMKQSLIDKASQRISVWQTKLLLGRKLTASELAQLNAWLDYLDILDALDADTSDDIQWPAQPA